MTIVSAQPEAIDPTNYRFLQQLVYDGSGITLEHDKHYLFEARLGSITRSRGLGSINELCALIRATREQEVQRLVVEAMTTNETYFFREPAQYDAIRTVLLPELRQLRNTTRKLSFWSSAASTGQELYSLAMLLADHGFSDWNLQLLGTDLSQKVLERARIARFLQIEVNRGLPASALVKHFRREGLDWQLNDSIRKMARFQTIDLRQSMRSFGPFDLVFCRNVLVYFDAATRQNILREIHGTLFRGGWLLLGSAEVPWGLDEFFERRTIGTSVIYTAR